MQQDADLGKDGHSEAEQLTKEPQGMLLTAGALDKIGPGQGCIRARRHSFLSGHLFEATVQSGTQEVWAEEEEVRV